jgi:hypothetical protein
MTTVSLPVGVDACAVVPKPPNPFSRPVIDGPRDTLATAESIHRAELARIVEVFDSLAAHPLPRLQRGPLALLVLSQMPGSGKSHLLGRLWRTLNGRATVIFLRAHQDRQAFWRRILERLVQELEYPEAADQRALAPGSATQLDSLARHLLADLMQRALQQKLWQAPPQIVEWVRQGRAEAMSPLRKKLPELMNWLNKLVPLWVGQLTAAGLQLERDPVAWLKVLVCYTLHRPGETPRSLALAWLQGNELEPEEARQLGLTASQQRVAIPGGSGEESLNESAFQCVKDLCALSAFFRPVVFAFDQTEIYGQSPELAKAFGATVGRLQAECINQLTVVTSNEQPWLHSISQHFERADLDRFDLGRRVLIKGINQAQATELVTVKMQGAGHASSDIDAFVARPWLAALFSNRAAASPLPRAVEQAACLALERWRTGGGDLPDPAPDAAAPAMDEQQALLERAMAAHRTRLLNTPKALDFDVGVLLWSLTTGMSRVPDLTVREGFHSARRKLQICWQMRGRTVFFVLDDSTHWKHWLAVVNSYHEHAEPERAQGRAVRGVVLWHRSLKPVGEGMRKQLGLPAAQGLVLLDLSDLQMAELYAAQALFFDVCQGDMPEVNVPTLLDFLGRRLQASACQLAGLTGPDAAVVSGAEVAPSVPFMPPRDVPAPAASRSAPMPPSASTTDAQLGVQRHHPNPPVTLPLAALARHSAVLGGTGSGKTTAALNLIEQVLAQGIPAVLLDRKGDLCRYAQPEAWNDPQWPPAPHFDPQRRAALHRRLTISVYTPGAIQGRGLRLPLAPAGLAQLPPEERDQAAHDSASVFAQALGLTRAADQPRKAVLVRVFQLLARRLETRGIVLDDVLELLSGDDPDLLASIGVLDPKLCRQLAEKVQTFKINSGSLLDERAEPLDWAQWLRPRPDGRIPLTIVSTKFLGDEGSTLFWVAQFFLELLRHVSRHPCDQLQGLLMIDEADLYLPATKVPATKGPLESLLKRARSGGVGLMLCTQSPGDLDYRGRDNIRNWLLGSIREARALEKLQGLLADSRVQPDQLSKQKAGQFVFAAEGRATPFDAIPNLVQTRQLSEPDILRVAASMAGY